MATSFWVHRPTGKARRRPNTFRPPVLPPRSGVWSPASLPGFAGDVFIGLARDAGLLWQDAAETVPAVAHTDPIMVAYGVFSGFRYAAPSAGARPTLYSEGGGKWSALFDGVDDRLVCPTGGTATGDITIWASARVLSTPTYSSVGGLGNGPVTGQRRAMAVRNSDRIEFNCESADQLFTGLNWSTTAHRRVVVMRTGQTQTAYGNGTPLTPGTTPGNTIVAFATTAVTVGCTPNTTVEFTNMRLAAFGFNAVVLPANEVALLDAYLQGVSP